MSHRKRAGEAAAATAAVATGRLKRFLVACCCQQVDRFLPTAIGNQIHGAVVVSSARHQLSARQSNEANARQWTANEQNTNALLPAQHNRRPASSRHNASVQRAGRRAELASVACARAPESSTPRKKCLCFSGSASGSGASSCRRQFQFQRQRQPSVWLCRRRFLQAATRSTAVRQQQSQLKVKRALLTDASHLCRTLLCRSTSAAGEPGRASPTTVPLRCWSGALASPPSSHVISQMKRLL